MAKKAQQTTRAATPEQEEDDFDPVVFQASLDQSVNAAKQLIASWIPADYGGGPSATSASASVQSLKDRARPPRMGLGAQPAAIHKQQAEDRRLKERLVGKGRNGTVGDEGSNVSLNGANNGQSPTVDADASDSEEEEDSRSRAISKGKGKASSSVPATTPTSSSAVKNAPNNPFVPKKTAPSASSSSAKSKSKSVDASAAANAIASTSTSTSAAAVQTLTPNAVGKAASAVAESDPTPVALSKNQRKKLRKLEREQENKNKLEAESRQEEEIERKALKRGRSAEVEEGDEIAEAADEMETEGVAETTDPGKSDDFGNSGPKKKKKKRKGKGSKTDQQVAPTPLLNL